jgi:hypothetical protein
MRNALRSLTFAFIGLTLAGCADFGPGTGPTAGRKSVLAVEPRFESTAAKTSALLAQVGIGFDNVRIIVVRPATDTLADTTITFSPTDTARALALAVLAVPNDQLTVTLQFRSGTSVLFQGSASTVAVPLLSNVASTNAVNIAVTYVGPGANAAKISITPGSGNYPTGIPTQFAATAFDAQNAAIADAPIIWSVSDTSIASVTSAGMVTPKVARGSVTLTATLGPISQSVILGFSPPNAGIRVVQGAAQTGSPGSQLALPLIIELDGSDGQANTSSGLSVTFVANNGGSITPATVPFDANGQAQANITLGANAGGIYLYTASVGTFSVLIPEVAVVGPPTQLIPNGPTTVTMTAGAVPNPVPGFRVADALGNSVPGVPLKATITLGTNTQTTPTFIADTIGVGDLSTIAHSLTVAGTYTVVIQSGVTPAAFPSLTYTITVNPAAASALAYINGPPTTITSNVTLSPVKVAIQDQFGNTVTTSTAQVTIQVDVNTGSGVTSTGSPTSVAAVSGIATFSGLKYSVTTTTVGVKLIAGATGLVSALTAGSTITP